MEKINCIYHSRDLDGYTSGAIVKYKYPNVNLIGYDYGEPIPFDKIPKGEPIIMVDISFDMDTMYEMAKHSNWQLTWIDHHISAIKEYEEYVRVNQVEFLTPVLDNNVAACEITWKYLYPESDMPRAVKLLGEYDTWRGYGSDRWLNEVLPFQFGLRMYTDSPETFPEYLFDEMFPDIESGEIIHDGKLILKYIETNNKQLCQRGSFELEFKGLKAICLNGGGFNSDAFKSVYDENKHDIMMPFQYNGKYWTVSLYTTKDDVDCSIIAKSMGGGGHKQAAGFQIDDINKILNEIVKNS